MGVPSEGARQRVAYPRPGRRAVLVTVRMVMVVVVLMAVLWMRSVAVLVMVVLSGRLGHRSVSLVRENPQCSKTFAAANMLQ